jgi:anti-anti-sigma factor
MIDFFKKSNHLYCVPKVDVIASNVPELRNALLDYLDNHSWESLIFDCRDVGTLDSVGVNLIVGLYKKTESFEKKFQVSGCNETILKILKLFKLDRKFTVEGRGVSESE